jgi:hypothetical protein
MENRLFVIRALRVASQLMTPKALWTHEADMGGCVIIMTPKEWSHENE